MSQTQQRPGSRDVTDRFAAFNAPVTKYTDEEGARDVTLSHDRNLLSPLVSSEAGHFIVQLKEQIPASVLPIEQVRDHALRSASQELRDEKTAALAASA